MKIEAVSLTKYYGKLCAVNKASFSFCSGRLTALVGRNGSGKTTILKMLLGLIQPDGGQVLLDGSQDQINPKRIGYLAEERGLLPKETVLRQLLFFAQLKDMNKGNALKAIDYWLEKMEVSQYKTAVLESLSKGNQQKIQMIASLLHDPEVVIFDEPFSGLDPVNMQLVIDLLRELAEAGKCVLVSSHQLALLEGVCEDICMIDQSEIVYFGNVQQLKLQRGGKDIRFSLSEARTPAAELGAEKLSVQTYRIPLRSGDESEIRAVFQALTNSDLPLVSLEKSSKSLQEIFLDLVHETKSKHGVPAADLNLVK